MEEEEGKDEIKPSLRERARQERAMKKIVETKGSQSRQKTGNRQFNVISRTKNTKNIYYIYKNILHMNKNILHTYKSQAM